MHSTLRTRIFLMAAGALGLGTACGGAAPEPARVETTESAGSGETSGGDVVTGVESSCGAGTCSAASESPAPDGDGVVILDE